MNEALIVLASGPVLAGMWWFLMRKYPVPPPVWLYPHIIICVALLAGWLAMGCPTSIVLRSTD